MCGIFLVYSKNNKLDKKICYETSLKLLSRGPDILKSSYFYEDRLFMANTILSITGNINKNKNIIASRNKNFFLTFNGEIYNYKNLQNDYLNNIYSTDTEVLVNLHEKIDCQKIPKILNGMFAYAILDKKKNKINIINDPQGEKSIYYYNSNKHFIASSTIESIVFFLKKNNVNLEIDELVLKNYFSTRHYMPIEKTCLKNIKILENSCKLNLNLFNSDIVIKKYDDPINWISEKKYLYYSKITESDLLEELDYELNSQIKLMIPENKFGSVFSGGIDSSLQSIILKRYSNSITFLNINHEKKDFINKKFNKFEKFLKTKINTEKINKKIYSSFAKKCSKILYSPLFTHDLPSRMFLAEKFKSKKCKVFFSADGCDELLGGQQIYLNVFKKIKNNFNSSPYSSVSKKSLFLNKYNTSSCYYNFIQKKWIEIQKKYNFIDSRVEKNIISSLYLDYFIQSIYVANKSTDLICCNSGVEPRNVFIQKNILKIFINLPLKYRINFSENKLYKQKYILKKLFVKYFNQNLIFPKEGFSGFPEVYDGKYNKIDTFISNFKIKIDNNYYYDLENYNRDLKWKLGNVDMFLNMYYNNL